MSFLLTLIFKYMKKKLINLCILFSLFVLSSTVIPQNECGTSVLSTSPVLVDFGGYLKPERTDLSNGQYCNGTFKMLFVFVQFPDEPQNSQSYEWPIGEPPIYINQLFAEQKVQTGNYWDRYSHDNQFFSDYYMEVSRGILDVTGITRNIKLSKSSSYYKSLGFPAGYNAILSEIYSRLYNDTQDPIDWETLDQWRRTSTGLFEYEADGYIDMIGIFFRTIPTEGLIWYDGAAGYVPLYGPEYELPNGKKFGPFRDAHGSGFICKGWHTAPNAKLRNFGIAIHEIGHYLYENIHSSSGIMTSRGGISINDFFYSGFERMKLGYVTANTVDWSNPEYQLDDVSGREGTTNLMMKVPISSTEFFLIENRRKISQYDIYMLGDTAGFNQFINAGDKGKGVYIYHSMNGLNYASNVDVECADGLWNWTEQGMTTPDWSDIQQVSIYARSTVCNPVNNDDGYFGSFINKDGVSSPYAMFTLGKRHLYAGQLGTVIQYTNTPDWYTSREIWGDRYDAWNIGYNEIFSPYSNPNTKDRYNNQTGIFIYYHDLINNKANISIYKVGEPLENPKTLDEILDLTPPSKPMGIATDYHFVSETLCHPKITWVNNTEPDVINPITGKIRYKLYRAYKLYMDQIPGPPVLIENDLEFYPNETPTYIDYQIIGYQSILSSDEPWLYPVRYWVKVVDNSYDESVFSDFTSAIGINDGSVPIGSGGDNLFSNSNIPKSFDLKQNYPNPFNPITNINFDLPKNILVTIKIYDLLGREIKTLVNEFKNAGSYIVSFNGSELASGVYFYRIQAGDFVSVKKMVLIK